MKTVAELESIAQQLVARIREDDPAANERWLHLAVPDPTDWFRLCFVVGAAVPVDQTWSQLTMWTYGDGGPDTEEAIEVRRAELVAALDGADARRRRAA